jgi:hypothetical protein
MAIMKCHNLRDLFVCVNDIDDSSMTVVSQLVTLLKLIK